MMLNLVKLTEIKEYSQHWRSQEKHYALREVLINPAFVVMVVEDPDFKERLIDFDLWPDGLHQKSIFTKVYLSNGSQNSSHHIYVIGNLEVVGTKLSVN